MSKVRASCRRVTELSSYVQINHSALQSLSQTYVQEPLPWSSFDFHYTGVNLIDYIFALDSLNFCFWPHATFDYGDLASNLKSIISSNPSGLSPSTISNFSISDVQKIFPLDFPDLETRLNKLNELGQVTCTHFSGDYSNLLEKSEKSALKLLDLIFNHYSGFRDVFTYKNQEVYLMKRAQILICDLVGAGCWEFDDMDQLTMFPDYQVPQVLNSKGVLVYSKELQEIVDNYLVIEKGSEYEIEIRAATVVACDLLAEMVGKPVYQVDWLLWQIGENEKKAGLLKPHHRTLTTFY